MLEDLLETFLTPRRTLDVAVSPDDLGQVAAFLRRHLVLGGAGGRGGGGGRGRGGGGGGGPQVDLCAHQQEGTLPFGVTLDFRQPGVGHALEGLPVTDRETEDQHLAGVVCVGSYTFVVTLHTGGEREKNQHQNKNQQTRELISARNA